MPLGDKKNKLVELTKKFHHLEVFLTGIPILEHKESITNDNNIYERNSDIKVKFWII